MEIPTQHGVSAVNAALLQSAETHAVVLLLLTVDRYGDEALSWCRETLATQLVDDYRVAVPSVNLDKLLIAATLLTTNGFFKDVNQFITACNVLAGDDFQPDEFDPAMAAEILWGITEALLIYPVNDNRHDTEFSPEVIGYITEVLKLEGVGAPPDVLRLGESQGLEQAKLSFADDPEMFSSIWKVQTEKSDNLKTILRDNLTTLAEQLTVLELRHGSTAAMVQRIRQAINR